MSEDVAGYLASKGLHLKPADKSNVHTSCMFCREPEGKRGRLYINVDDNADIPGLFMCHLCGERGSLSKIKRFYGDPVSDGGGRDRGELHYDVIRLGAEFFHSQLRSVPQIVQWLQVDRGLDVATIKKFKLGWADGQGNVITHLKGLGHSEDDLLGAGFLVRDKKNNVVRPFFNDVVTIPYYVGPTCVGIREKKLGGKYRQPFGWTQRIYNVDAIRGADQLVVTEGEFDCMLAEQMGYHAVGVPGSSQWQDSWNAQVKDVKRFWVVFDNDDAGRKGAERIAQSLGPRVKIANIPPGPSGEDDDGNDISAWIVEQKHDAVDFDQHLRSHRNTLLITVDEAIEEWKSVQNMVGLKFGYKQLDEAIDPGLLPGQVVVVLAKTNTGKTIWLLNTMHRMSMVPEQAECKFLFMSLEQTRGDWFVRAQRIYAFYDLSIGPVSGDPREIEAFDARALDYTAAWWRHRLMLTDKNRIGRDELHEILDDYEDMHGKLPDVVAIDYLGYMARAFPGKDKYEKTSEAIMTVKEVAKDRRIVVLLPHQVSRTAQFGQKFDIDTARDSGAIEETADFVFTLHNPDHGTDQRTGKLNMEIGKSRHGGKGTPLHYRFSPLTLTLVPDADPDERRAIQELEWGKIPWQYAALGHRLGKRPPHPQRPV